LEGEKSQKSENRKISETYKEKNLRISKEEKSQNE
jgi:hypothetical protein